MYKHFIFILLSAFLFTANTSAQEGLLNDRPADGVLADDEVIIERRPVELPHIRQADILWGKRVWQNIDLRQTMNQALYFPEEPHGGYRSLMQVLRDAILDGSINAYHSDDDSFRGDILDPQALFAALAGEVTLSREDQGLPDTTVVVPFATTQVMRYRIKEDWFIDKRHSKLDVRIVGIAPQREVRDPATGEAIGFETLFWIPYEQAREVLVNAPVYTRFSDIQQLSFDDLFLRRFFSGTIYREQRADGRVIAEYIEEELDRLLEDRRIKDEIRNRELDLWHY